MENVPFYLFLVFLLVILQGILWAWIGMRARKLFPWWPIMREEEERRYNRRTSYR